MRRRVAGALCGVLLLGACAPRPVARTETPVAPGYDAFQHPERVTLQGYDGDAMEPFVTRDGRYLLFNDSNDPRANTNLHYAERVHDLLFDYRGEVRGANSSALDGVPSMDHDGNFYFVSTRRYQETLSTLYRGRWHQGRVLGVALLEGVSEKLPGAVNFDAEISANGLRLYFVDGLFGGGPLPRTADLAVAVNDGNAFRRVARLDGLFARINTDKLEYAPATSVDELELFFTRLDVTTNEIGIYRATRRGVTRPFEAPQRVSAITGFAEAPTLSPDGRSLYYHRKEANRYVINRVTR
jgi:hypothetical protein